MCLFMVPPILDFCPLDDFGVQIQQLQPLKVLVSRLIAIRSRLAASLQSIISHLLSRGLSWLLRLLPNWLSPYRLCYRLSFSLALGLSIFSKFLTDDLFQFFSCDLWGVKPNLFLLPSSHSFFLTLLLTLKFLFHLKTLLLFRTRIWPSNRSFLNRSFLILETLGQVCTFFLKFTGMNGWMNRQGWLLLHIVFKVNLLVFQGWFSLISFLTRTIIFSLLLKP